MEEGNAGHQAHSLCDTEALEPDSCEDKTLIYNPVIACLAGGRNKNMAAKAYDLFNAQLSMSNLKVYIPETINDVKLREVPLWVDRFGGHAVIKNPYSNGRTRGLYGDFTTRTQSLYGY